MSALETVMAAVGGAGGLAAIVGAGVQTVRSRADVAKARAAADLARAEADRTEARTRESMQNLVAEQLGQARGDLVKAREAAEAQRLDAEAAKRERTIAAGKLAEADEKHVECERRVAACEDKHDERDRLDAERAAELGAAKGTIAQLDGAVQDLSGRLQGLQRAMGVSDETIRRMSPPHGMPAVKPEGER